MKYPDKQQIMLGDTIELYPNISGKVVCLLEEQQFCPGFVRSDWEHLKKGVLVQSSNKGGIVHFEEAEPTFRLIHRAQAYPELRPEGA